MVASIQTLRIRSFFGLVLVFLGFFGVIFAVSLGISGLVMHYGKGDLFWLGNPGAGPGVTFFLIIEGFLLELVLALSTVLFGYSIKGNLHTSLNLLKKAKSKLGGKGKAEFQDLDDDLEESQPKKKKSCPWCQKFTKDFEVKAPKCLWISLLLLSGVNLGLSLTCRVLAGGNELSGLGQAMRNYGTDPDARRALDWVQQAGECCGSQVYTDWLNVQWCTERPRLVPSEVGPPGYVNVCGPKHRSVKNDVPESCCTPARSPCIHDPMDLIGLGALHNDGCAQYIEEQLSPKYISIAKFHLFLGIYKLILMGLVLLLRPKDDPRSETATDEEAKHLIDDEDAKKTGLSGLLSKTNTKSLFSGFAWKDNPPSEASNEQNPTKEGKAFAPKQNVSKKLISSTIKFTEPVKKMSKIIHKEEGKTPGSPATERAGTKEKETVGSQATYEPAGTAPVAVPAVGLEVAEEKPGSLGPSSPSRSARPASEEMRQRGIEMRSSKVSRTQSYNKEPVSPRPDVRGSLSEWSKPLAASKPGVFGPAAAQITPSRHEERRLSAVGVVN